MRQLLVFLLCLWPFLAHSGDGALEWRTVSTPHFELHYPKHLTTLAHRAARLCEEAHTVLSPLMGHKPDRRVQVVLNDFGDFANGSATALPYPKVQLFAAPPTLDGNLNDYDDWLRLLIFHEYTHILQLDNVSGIPAFLNTLFGRRFAPNQALPSFNLEGEAVWAESLTSGRGRIRSAVFRGTLRAQALAGTLPGIDAMTHAPQTWPGANVWYMHGGHFMDWIARTRGLQVAAQTHDAMSDALIPFALNRGYLESTGQRITALHRAWVADLTARSLTEKRTLEQAGLTPITAITHTGQRNTSPRFLPDGTLLALRSVPGKPYGIYRFDGKESTLLIDVEGASRFEVCSDGHTLLWATPQLHRGAYVGYDLFGFDLKTGSRHRLSRGQRVRSPACAPNGLWAAGSQIFEGRTRLVRLRLADGALTVLHDPGELDQMAQPVVSPDGTEVVAIRASQRHGRDLVAVDVATGAVRRLTQDDAMELHPRFSPDGQWLIYASDRSGIFDLYAKPWPHGPARRLTRVLNGAFDPTLAPDGKSLVFRYLSGDGSDLYRTPFAPEPGVETVQPRPLAKRRPVLSTAPLPSTPYQATSTLWPVAWSPSFTFSNITDALDQTGIDLLANDVAGQHFLVGSLVTAPEEEALTASLAYSYHGFVPSLAVNLSHATRTRAQGALYGSALNPWQETATRGGATVSLPLGRAGRSGAFSVRYNYGRTRPAENVDPVHDPLDRAPVFPENTQSGNLSVTLGYGDLESSPLAVSAEQGRRLGATLRFRHPHLGGDLSTAEIFVNYQEYISLWQQHVLALRFVGAFGRGDAGRRLFYSLGAPIERNVLLDALDEIYMGDTVLRGYPSGIERGDRYALVTAEYRMPLASIFRGVSTVPVFFQRFKFAFFTDWAQARSHPLTVEIDDFRRSVGAELVSEATIGWRLAMSVRLGYAVGLDDGGEDQMYFFLGQWF